MNAYQQQAAQAALQNQRTELWNIYFSAVRFQAVRSGAGPFVYTVAAGTELRPFGYAIGDDLALSTVGYPAGYGGASACETNLQKRSETVSGEAVEIRGISAHLTADSDAYLAMQLLENVSVSIGMNGDQQQYRLGRLAFLPAAGGLSGQGITNLLTPPIAEAFNPGVGAMANGIPSVNNFLPMPAPLWWKPSGGADSTFVMRLRAERAVAITSTARAAAAGVAAYDPPAANAAGTWVGIVIRLHSRQIGARSINM